MTEIKLSNGIKVPTRAYGTYLTDKSEFGCINCTKEAIKSGIRHIDTAFVYGNQELVGEAIKQCIDEGIVKREDLFITSKIPDFEFSYTNTFKIVENSLKAMQLDYFDMYLLHSPYRTSKDWEKLVADSWCALEKLYDEGKVKSIRVSNFNIIHLVFLLHNSRIHPMINQIEVHPQHQQKDLIRFCQEHNIAVSCWGALNQGRIFKNETFMQLASKYNKEISHIAIKWSLQKGYIPIVTSTKKERIKNLYHIDDFTLSEEDMNTLDNLDGGEFSNWHTENEKPAQLIDINQIFDYMKSAGISKESVSGIYKYKLFGFIPFIKVKRKGFFYKKVYLFGIPILKISKKKG